MKALVYDGKQAVYKEDVKDPVCRPEQSLIQVIYADICSTDREILKGYRPDFCGIMGHEFVGKVLESPDPSLIGKTVVGEINEGCGTCLYCKTGREKHCLNRHTLGMSRDGCFAEKLALATHLIHPVPEGLSPEQAVFAEPLAAAIEILEQVNLDTKANAAIIGDGRLAFMIAQVIAHTGIDLTVIGKHEDKLELFAPYAKTALVSDFDKSLSPEECFEYVIEACGNESGIHLALRIVRKMGAIILKSTYAGKTTLDLSQIPVNEISLIGSRCGPFDKALEYLKCGHVSFPPVELYELKDYEAAFSSPAFKAGFKF